MLLRQDLAFAGRMLRRQPAFAVAAVLALALGIGATTAVFSIVDAVLWRPLPFARPTELVFIGEQRPREQRVNGPVAPADFLDWRASSRSFSAMAASTGLALNLTGDIEPQRVDAMAVSSGFFETIGVMPAIGRPFRADEEDPGKSHVAILSDGLWRRAFGARPDVLGQTVWLNAEPYEIVGVLRADFWWTTRPDIVVPRPFDARDRVQRAIHMFPVIARLAPGVTIDQARAEMDTIGRRLADEHPNENRYHFPEVTAARDIFIRGMRQPLLMLLAAVGVLLLIACGNVSTLLVARATARRSEIAIRATLGAGRARIVRQLLTESALLAALGGLGGILIAEWLVSVATALLPPRLLMLPGLDRISVDIRVMAASLAATSLAVVLFGLVPACTASEDDAAAALAEGGRSGSAGVRTQRVRAALIVGVLALSLVLLVGAALLMVSFQRLLDVQPGFDPDHLVTMRVTLPEAKYGEYSRVTQFYASLIERLRASGGINAAAVVTLPPFGGLDSHSNFLIEGRTTDMPFPIRARTIAVSADYARTMRIPLLRGRFVTAADTDASPLVVVINETAARRFWPNEDAVGRRISFQFDKPQWLEIVGVVGDVKGSDLQLDPEPEAYISYLQKEAVGGSVRAMTVVVRTSLALDAVSPLLRESVTSLDRGQPVARIRAMDDLVAESIAPRRLNLWLLLAFSAIAVVLTGEGLYGVMAYVVAQRTQEIGIRVALGATPREIVRMMLRDAARVTAAGIVAGLLLAMALSRWLASELFGVSATDPFIYLAVSLILAAVALAAAAIPSSRATRVDPLAALRQR